MNVVKNERGFTLVEMLLVMMVITVLLLVMVPNVTKNSSMIGDKGCEAMVHMVEAQMQTYRLDHGQSPTSIGELNNPEYLQDKFDGESGNLYCPNGRIVIIEDGKAKPSDAS